MKRKFFLLNIFLFMILMTGCNLKKKYTIYFVSENTLVKEITTRGNELIELPQNIVKEAYYK